jgi:hypothetical protein
MRNAISFESVREVRIGPTKSAVIAGKDISGAETEAFLKLSDIAKVVPALLCCSHANATASPPLPGTIIPGCHLPIAKWATGRSELNGEPLLIISLFGGTVLTLQFPSQAAVECGQALTSEGIATGPTPGSKTN